MTPADAGKSQAEPVAHVLGSTPGSAVMAIPCRGRMQPSIEDIAMDAILG